MAIAAHSVPVYVKASSSAPSAGDLVDGIKDITAKDSRTMLDTTDFLDSSGAKTKLAGLLDASISLSGDYEQSDAPQALLRSSYTSGATVYITLLPDGTNGYTYPCIVESYDVKAGVDGLVEFSASLVGNGARTARP